MYADLYNGRVYGDHCVISGWHDVIKFLKENDVPEKFRQREIILKLYDYYKIYGSALWKSPSAVDLLSELVEINRRGNRQTSLDKFLQTYHQIYLSGV